MRIASPFRIKCYVLRLTNNDDNNDDYDDTDNAGFAQGSSVSYDTLATINRGPVYQESEI